MFLQVLLYLTVLTSAATSTSISLDDGDQEDRLKELCNRNIPEDRSVELGGECRSSRNCVQADVSYKCVYMRENYCECQGAEEDGMAEERKMVWYKGERIKKWKMKKRKRRSKLCKNQDGLFCVKKGRCAKTFWKYKCNNRKFRCCKEKKTVIKHKCGSVLYRNNTYMQNPRYPNDENGGTACHYIIKKMSSNICYLRLDLKKFFIADHDLTSTVNTERGRCRIDKMTTTCSKETGMPDDFCSDNTGDHVYLSVGGMDSCRIDFELGTGAATERKWKIRVSQIECNAYIKPPTGCLSYYLGATGTIKSLLYRDALQPHPSNHHYSICIRKEYGMCSITYEVNPDATIPFSLSGAGINAGTCTLDYVTIPNGQGPSTIASNTFVSRFCGTVLNSEDGATTNEPITSKTTPFLIEVTFSEREGAASQQAGFCLNYKQNPC